MAHRRDRSATERTACMDGASNTAGPPTEALAGLVERVTFHNAETGFCVLRVKARGQRDLVTVVGHAATIAAGEWVQLLGQLGQRPHPWPAVQGRASSRRPRRPRWRASRSTSAPA